MEKISIEKNVKKIKTPALLIAISLFIILLSFPIFNNAHAQKAFAQLAMVVPHASSLQLY